MKEYNNVCEYYIAEADILRDEAERIADDICTKELIDLENNHLLPIMYRVNLKHCVRSTRKSLYALRLSFYFIKYQLCSAPWWEITHNKLFTSKEIIFHMVESYDISTKRGYLIGVFSTLEHSMRHFLRILDKSESSTNNFWKIRDAILSLDPKLSQYKNVLGLFANIRNTTHNDGLYYSPKGENVTIEYKGRSYNFIHSKPIDFSDWTLLLQITEDILSLFHDLKTCEVLIKKYKEKEDIESSGK